MTRVPQLPVQGSLVVLTEQAYRYDVRELRLRVERVVADRWRTPDTSTLEWVRIIGHAIMQNAPDQPRNVMVRMGALMRSRTEDKARDERTR